MTNLKIFGDVEQVMPYYGDGSSGMPHCVCEEWYAGFAIMSSIALVISIFILILGIRDKKSKFRIPVIVLSAIMIVLCIASLIMAIGLYEKNV